MSVTKVTCPGCQATLQTAKPLAPGARVKCPKCTNPFTVPAAAPASGVRPGPHPASRTAVPKVVAKRPALADDLDDAEDAAEGRPRRKKLKRKKKAGTGVSVVILVTACVAILIFAGAVGWTFLSPFLDSKKDAVVHATGTATLPRNNNRPDEGDDSPLPGDPRETPKYAALDSIDWSAVDVGKLEGAAVADLPTLRYVPSEMTEFYGIDFKHLSQNSALMAMMTHMRWQSTGRDDFPLNPNHLDHVLLAQAPRAGKLPGSGKALELTLFRSSASVRTLLSDAHLVPAQALGKTYYRPERPSRVDFIYRPTPRLLMLGSNEELTPVLHRDGKEPALPKHVFTLARRLGPAHFWTILDGPSLREFWTGLTKFFPKGKETDALKPLLDQAQLGGVWWRAQNKEIQFTFGTFLPEAGAATRIAGELPKALERFATAMQGFKLLVPPEYHPLLDALRTVQVERREETVVLTLKMDLPTVVKLLQAKPESSRGPAKGDDDN